MNDEVVCVIDDDDDVRTALQLLLESVGLTVKNFSSAIEYLEQFDATLPGCLIVDIRMPGMSGLELQQKLVQEKLHPPIIIITGHGDISIAVKAVKAGAVDFIEKPFNNQNMLDVVHRAIEFDSQHRGITSSQIEVEEKYENLTPREKEVMKKVVEGLRNKVIATDLNVTQSTVEAHRSKVMEKMKAQSLSDLMRMGISLNII
ncbi:MAG: response regulator transcription factor [Gammaproteobacteria bacterium]|nr:response regulator transcription factor [Gammaproteobacteria bacterium]